MRTNLFAAMLLAAADGTDLNDTLIGTAGDDLLHGRAGPDVLLGNGGNDTLDGGADADLLYGDAGDDSLLGGDGNDELHGGTGNDVLDGGDGLDMAFYGIITSPTGGSVVLIEADWIISGTERDRLIGIERISVGGGAFSDIIAGSWRDEIMVGGTGDDTLDGAAGNDSLFGGPGTDQMMGGLGRDRFQIGPFANWGVDVVMDFEAGDQLVFQTRLNGGEQTVDMTIDRVSQGDGAGLGLGQVHVQAVEGGVRVRAGIDDNPGYDVEVMLRGALDPSRFVSAGRGVSYGEQSADPGTPGNDLIRGTSGDDMLLGWAGNDSIIGSGGTDQVDGGRGIDAFGVNASSAELELLRLPVIGSQAQGAVVAAPLAGGGRVSTLLNNVEFLYLSDRVLLLTALEQGVSAALPLGFSEQGYLAANPDVEIAVEAGTYRSGWAHYQAHGQAEGRVTTALFDTDWYLARNADVAAAVSQGAVTALSHYMANGWREGRDPCAAFDTSAYLDRYSDVAAAGVNPLAHYIAWGQVEGRIITAVDAGWIG